MPKNLKFRISFAAITVPTNAQKRPYIKHPLLTLECKSEHPSLTFFPDWITANDSTIHSYHTFLPSVCRQMLTHSRELAGMYIGA